MDVAEALICLHESAMQMDDGQDEIAQKLVRALALACFDDWEDLTLFWDYLRTVDPVAIIPDGS